MNCESIKVQSILSRQEILALTRKSDVVGLWLILWNWLLIFGSFIACGVWPNIGTFALGLVILGNRQLGLGILMHDCSHFALFASGRLNRLFGRWLCAMPMFLDLDRYRQYHFRHHTKAGTSGDPDRPNYLPYPVSRASFRRKLLRDLTGITGLKNFIISAKMYAGLLDYELSYKTGYREGIPDQVKHGWRQFIFVGLRILPCFWIHFSIWAILWRCGFGWTYLLWPIAYMTTYSFFSRIRNAAEHAAVPNIHSRDPLQNTRTTLASWWERLTFAPNYVNFHLEHHLLPHVPPYRLAYMHRLLKQRGALAHAIVAPGYSDVMRSLLNLSEPRESVSAP